MSTRVLAKVLAEYSSREFLGWHSPRSDDDEQPPVWRLLTTCRASYRTQYTRRREKKLLTPSRGVVLVKYLAASLSLFPSSSLSLPSYSFTSPPLSFSLYFSLFPSPFLLSFFLPRPSLLFSIHQIQLYRSGGSAGVRLYRKAVWWQRNRAMPL